MNTEQRGEFSLQEIAAFLDGSAPLDGVWFGEKHPTEPGLYWWRKHLKAALTTAPANGQQGVDVPDDQADEIANRCYRELRSTGWSGSMGGLQWDRALVRAALTQSPKPEQAIPAELFDGYAVYSSLTDNAKRRTSPENVSDTLDAVVKLIRAKKPEQAGERKYFYYSPDVGFNTVDSLEEAKKYANAEIDDYREQADQEWPPEVDEVCIGCVIAETVEVETAPGGCDYVLEAIVTTTPRADEVAEQPAATMPDDIEDYILPHCFPDFVVPKVRKAMQAYATTHTAEAVRELVDGLDRAISQAEMRICTHDETHRGGAIWEICDQCGAKWADDEGGKPEFEWPKAIIELRALLAKYKEPK